MHFLLYRTVANMDLLIPGVGEVGMFECVHICAWAYACIRVGISLFVHGVVARCIISACSRARTHTHSLTNDSS